MALIGGRNMKKLIFFIILIFFPLKNVFSKTLDDLYKKLDDLNYSKEIVGILSEEDREILFADGLNMQLIINSLNEEINKINSDIIKKEEEIEKIQKEVNNMLILLQTSSGENTSLNYILDSSSYSELIYRWMIIKQLVEYNNNLLNTLNSSLSQLNDKKAILDKKIEKLNNQRNNYLEIENIIRASGESSANDLTTTLDEDIASLVEEISIYENMGCDRYLDLSFCLNMKNIYNLNYPLMKGCVSSDYEISKNNIHMGIDLACNAEGNNVYAAGYGVVASVIRKSTCGGNIVFIYHLVNNKKYTTIYGHLLDIKVNVGETVDNNSVIGTVGGDSTSYKNGGYDRCTNGAHLHFAITEGYHTSDFSGYTFNPRYIFDFPPVLNGYFIK